MPQFLDPPQSIKKIFDAIILGDVELYIFCPFCIDSLMSLLMIKEIFKKHQNFHPFIKILRNPFELKTRVENLNSRRKTKRIILTINLSSFFNIPECSLNKSLKIYQFDRQNPKVVYFEHRERESLSPPLLRSRSLLQLQIEEVDDKDVAMIPTPPPMERCSNPTSLLIFECLSSQMKPRFVNASLISLTNDFLSSKISKNHYLQILKKYEVLLKNDPIKFKQYKLVEEEFNIKMYRHRMDFLSALESSEEYLRICLTDFVNKMDKNLYDKIRKSFSLQGIRYSHLSKDIDHIQSELIQRVKKLFSSERNEEELHQESIFPKMENMVFPSFEVRVNRTSFGIADLLHCLLNRLEDFFEEDSGDEKLLRSLERIMRLKDLSLLEKEIDKSIRQNEMFYRFLERDIEYQKIFDLEDRLFFYHHFEVLGSIRYRCAVNRNFVRTIFRFFGRILPITYPLVISVDFDDEDDEELYDKSVIFLQSPNHSWIFEHLSKFENGNLEWLEGDFYVVVPRSERSDIIDKLGTLMKKKAQTFSPPRRPGVHYKVPFTSPEKSLEQEKPRGRRNKSRRGRNMNPPRYYQSSDKQFGVNEMTGREARRMVLDLERKDVKRTGKKRKEREVGRKLTFGNEKQRDRKKRKRE